MTSDDFVEKWRDVELSERAPSHSDFGFRISARSGGDLCRLIDQPTPADADPTGADYCFEKAVKVTMAASKGSKRMLG